MHEVLVYVLSFISLGLIAHSVWNVKRSSALEKLLKVGEILYRNQVPIAEIEKNFDIIFIDAESEAEFIKKRELHDTGRSLMIFYQAPEYRINLFRRKMSDHMIICKDFNKELERALDVKNYPSLLRVNLLKVSVKKII